MSEPPRPAELFQLDRQSCLALLSAQHVGRLIAAGAESPVVVVNYTLHDETVVFRADPGPRISSIIDATVVFEVDMYDERTRSGWSVVVRGTARDATAPAGVDPDVAVDTWAPGPKSRWIGIAVEDVTGRLLRGEVPATWVHRDAYL
jgi:nitroimidazol reductase NimA-like FMN-containing flavoprotein (pyridoxamine 5'-phosphate oxidase superfamily)